MNKNKNKKIIKQFFISYDSVKCLIIVPQAKKLAKKSGVGMYCCRIQFQKTVDLTKQLQSKKEYLTKNVIEP